MVSIYGTVVPYVEGGPSLLDLHLRMRIEHTDGLLFPGSSGNVITSNTGLLFYLSPQTTALPYNNFTEQAQTFMVGAHRYSAKLFDPDGSPPNNGSLWDPSPLPYTPNDPVNVWVTMNGGPEFLLGALGSDWFQIRCQISDDGAGGGILRGRAWADIDVEPSTWTVDTTRPSAMDISAFVSLYAWTDIGYGNGGSTPYLDTHVAIDPLERQAGRVEVDYITIGAAGDLFNRSVGSGWGGSWLATTVTSNQTLLSVDGASGVMAIPSDASISETSPIADHSVFTTLRLPVSLVFDEEINHLEVNDLLPTGTYVGVA